MASLYFLVKTCGYFLNSCSYYSSDTYWEDIGWQSVPAPTNLQASDMVRQGQVQLSWDAIPTQSTMRYEVYRAEAPDAPKESMGERICSETCDPTFVDTFVPPGTGNSFYYWVMACSEEEICSPLSNMDSSTNPYLIYSLVVRKQ